MGYHDLYRMSSHAVILNDQQQVLLLKATYGDKAWGLPGGGLDPNETIHDALHRECLEELGCAIDVDYLSGVYYHQALNAHACIFRCQIEEDQQIQLSEEHSEYAWFNLGDLSEVQKIRVLDCLSFEGIVQSRIF
ncbi:ADP-ribose pyrophosphatase YjhB, NUDIX family [Acinetobacter marinus]|uniref:ADP-ribose pyrophosphatase YjhB, NUDIX family n=1 Tax=Acinetobacter marinus TaxID=281375 RepID=A0A1G6GKT9_9GAMM|nr:NUDIX domain-containing protein [Acinetobacter marinus]SDB82529.1 ADP-ribose pyrophosphatase YjhB, NUDIX family [Acinetobacter marinus]